MLDKETYKREIIRMWDSIRDKHKGEYSCYGVDCDSCPLGRKCDRIFSIEIIEAVEKWSKEHPQKHKVSQLEYDILESIVKTISSGLYFFECDSLLMSLLEKGYFDGATGETDVKEYFENLEIIKIVKKETDVKEYLENCDVDYYKLGEK